MNLFAYGTLKTGQPRNHILTPNFLYFGEGKVPGFLYSFGDKFPVLRVDYGTEEFVTGEVWRPKQWDMKDVMTELDEIEGVPILFTQRYIDVVMLDDMDEETGEPLWIECVTYVGASETMYDEANLIEEWPIQENAGAM